MAIERELVVKARVEGTGTVEQSVRKVDKALISTAGAADKAAASFTRAGASAAKTTQATQGLIGKAGELGEALDKNLEQRYGRIFKATDRVRSIMGQLTGALGLVGLAVTGAAAAYSKFTMASDKAAKSVKAQTDALKAAEQAQKDLAAATGVAAEQFTAAQVLQQIFTSEAVKAAAAESTLAASRIKMADDRTVAITNEMAALRLVREQSKEAGKTFSIEQRARLDALSKELETEMALRAAAVEKFELNQKELRALSAQAKRTAADIADVFAPQGPGLGGRTGETPKPSGVSASERAARDTAIDERIAQMDLELEGLEAEVAGLSAPTQAVLDLEMFAPLADTAAIAFDSVADSVARAVDQLEAMTFFDSKAFADGMLAIGDATSSMATAFIGAAIEASIAGESIESAVNAAATRTFVNASMRLLEVGFSLPWAAVFAPATVPAIAASGAAALTGMAVSGAVAGATGGLGAASAAAGTPGAPSVPATGGGAVGSQPADPFARDDDQPTETVVNVNFVAQSDTPRQDAYNIGIAIGDLLGAAGLAVGRA